MAPKRRFQPRLEGSLEARVVLSSVDPTSVITLAASGEATNSVSTRRVALGRRVPRYLIGSDGRGVQYRDSSTTRISDAIDRAFDSFTVDYLEAQAAYLNSASEGPVVLPVMRNATRQRVELLNAQLLQAMARIPNSLKRQKGAPESPLQAFLRRRISDPREDSGSLLDNLLRRGVPASPSVTDADATLYTFTATNTIEAARVATVNASKFLISGVFSKKH